MPNNDLTRKMSYLADLPLLPQAATDIRQQIAQLNHPQPQTSQTASTMHLNEEKAISSELPDGVWDYIKQHNLYGYR